MKTFTAEDIRQVRDQVSELSDVDCQRLAVAFASMATVIESVYPVLVALRGCVEFLPTDSAALYTFLRETGHSHERACELLHCEVAPDSYAMEVKS